MSMWEKLCAPIFSLLKSCGPYLGAAPGVMSLSADGSSRRFFRLMGAGHSVLALLPPEHALPKDLAEAASVFHIGRHLHAAGAATPEIYGYDEESGLILCEDFGDTRLHGAFLLPGQEKERLEFYQETLSQLARMQVRGASGFKPGWCWDTPCYDTALMQERESGYFLRACCQNLLGLRFDQETLFHECACLAQEAAQAPSIFFLHRDCQSRNVMIFRGRPAFIDFQGGRLGPLAYDVAALLIDPYAALSEDMQNCLLAGYLKALDQEISYDHRQFLHEYLFLALQRNLQILGAFAFLSQVRGKPFFAPYLKPAARSLATLLARPECARYVGLQALCHQCMEKL